MFSPAVDRSVALVRCDARSKANLCPELQLYLGFRFSINRAFSVQILDQKHNIKFNAPLPPTE